MIYSLQKGVAYFKANICHTVANQLILTTITLYIDGYRE